ncbi:S28 family serine protease [Streptomyces sp. H27-D2]|uniref:S28 family serine protease n=1 Tax=Streptomyces sp. H27-D2 TaxID=3046304 RepID=UPI002DBFCFA1|nr:S28 family serine protease [Streptomyces sp. H27-D2]MEC4018102.1 S28 family serine protease [Streptomyces sp. H27-D2]
MRKALRWLLSLVVLIGTIGIGSASAGSATAAEPDIKDRILAIPGMSLIEEKPAEGYRYFVLNYTQPIDHRHPSKGTFKQRLTLLHKSEDRPTVFFTSGYNLNIPATPSRSEPTRIVDGNQVSMEYRFFTPSRPQPADWSKLDIWQAASDQHRIYTALKTIYSKNWLATGGSKGGMTATYFRRFYPHDMDGTVAYVAPNDVVNKEDSAYDRFFAKVSTKECRTKLNAIQREALVRRDGIVDRYKKWAYSEGQTFKTIGSADKAFENVVNDLVWAFWQYSTEADCADVPATTASTDVIYDYVDAISGFSAYTDQGLEPYTPYYYQAGTQLGSPTVKTPHLNDLLRYRGTYVPRSYVPRDIPMTWHNNTMRDVDRWVNEHAEQMLFVYGQNDPWGAEPFRPGKHAEDSYVFTAPGGNHGSNIAQLKAGQKEKATAEVLEWAGVAPAAVREGKAEAKPLAPYDAKMDKRELEREPLLRP